MSSRAAPKRDPELMTTNGTNFKPHLAATVLVEAAYRGDDEAAAHWNVSTRSILNWRKRLENDPEFAAVFANKKDRFEAGWRDELGSALRAGIDFLRRAAQVADPTNHEVIFSIAGAVKILADVNISMDVLNARLVEYDRQTTETDQSLATDEASRESITVLR